MAADRPNEGSEGSAEDGKNDPRALKYLAFILAIVALAFAATNLWRAAHPPPVAAEFTRVGGANRVETAADAATFWLSPPSRYYAVSPRADTDTVLHAANCAMHHDAPLLFLPLKGKTPPADSELMANWQSASPFWVGSPTVRCPGGTTLPNRMHTWTNNEQALPGGSAIGVQFAIHQQTELEPFVVFAASVSPSASRSPTSPEQRTDTRDLPDVAVGLALAAHIARGSKGRDVSLVVIPPYLEANPGLEQSLRGDTEAVNGGIVLGDAHRIPDETVALLRQILRARDWSGILADVHDFITQVGAVIAAFVGLLLIGVGVVKGVPLAWEEGGRGVEMLSKKVSGIVNGPRRTKGRDPEPDKSKTASQSSATEPSETPQSSPTGAAERPTPFTRGRRKDPRVALYLNSGGVLTGFFEGEETLGGVKVVKLSGVEISRGMPWDQPDPGAQPGPKAEVTLVPATEVALAVRYAGDPAPSTADS